MAKEQKGVRYANNKPSGTNKKKRKKKHPILGAFMKTILILFLIGIIVGFGLVYGFVQSVVNGAGALAKEDFTISEFTTTIYDKDGNVYSQLFGKENRTYVSLSETSPYLKDAFISIEDERFESHFGIDVKRTTAAVINYITKGNSDFGGSTITQQLIKKVTTDDDRSWQRKAREIVRAVQVEQWLSKDEIIEMYMNLIYLGEGAYGVEKAAYTYFDKSAEDLSIAECALIAGLAQSPEGKNPYNYPEEAIERQRLVLGKMYELGKITKAQYDEAIAEELVFKKGDEELTAVNSYFVDALVEQLKEDIMNEKNVTDIMAEKMIYSNGLKIYTTLDPDIQRVLEEVYSDENYFKLSNGKYDPEIQSAMVIIDYKRGNVVGLIGGAGEKNTLRSFNRATMMTRAPGSTIKPVATYAPGIDTGKLTPAMTFDDSPYTIRVGGAPWTPKNAYGGYRGLTSVRKGIEVSSNIVAAKAFNVVGIDTSYSYLKKFGYTTLTGADQAPGALALGGLTNGFTPLEHAAAYGSLANGGIYVSPKLYTKVLDMNSQVILENTSEVHEVVKESTAYIITNMLQDVVNGYEATGSDARFANMAIAGKTGTSNDSKDRWFAGYTPYYSAATWVGYDIQKTINMSGNPAAKIWKAVMEKIHTGLSNPGFSRPGGIVTASICADSGLLATDICKHDRRGDRTKTEMFVSGTVPTKSCELHKYVTVCADSYKMPNPACEQKHAITQIVCIDRGYENVPSVLPRDWDYETPHTYCEFHYCPKDEAGNYIVEPVKPIVDWSDFQLYDDNMLNRDTKSNNSKTDSTKTNSNNTKTNNQDKTTDKTKKEDNKPSNVIDDIIISG